MQWRSAHSDKMLDENGLIREIMLKKSAANTGSFMASDVRGPISNCIQTALGWLVKMLISGPLLLSPMS